MECCNHPDVAAIDRCVGCAESFCHNCLVEIGGQRYCGSCKVMALQGCQIAAVATVPCKEAEEAFRLSILAIFVAGAIVGPISIAKACKAKTLIRKSATLTGSGKASTAIIIGAVATLLWVVGFITQLSV